MKLIVAGDKKGTNFVLAASYLPTKPSYYPSYPLRTLPEDGRVSSCYRKIRARERRTTPGRISDCFLEGLSTRAPQCSSSKYNYITFPRTPQSRKKDEGGGGGEGEQSRLSRPVLRADERRQLTAAAAVVIGYSEVNGLPANLITGCRPLRPRETPSFFPR